MLDKNDDIDPIETKEWLDALEYIAKNESSERAKYIMRKLRTHAVNLGVNPSAALTTSYRNTIAVKDEAHMPGDLFTERRIRSFIRWNAMAMVMRANDNDEGLGGHISSFSSSATLYDIGLTIFSEAMMVRMKLIWCFFKDIYHQAFTLAPILKVA